MNSTIETLMRHASVREFTSQGVSDSQREAILMAARATSSSSFLQLVSIIRITDGEIRAQLAHLAGEQPYVAGAAEFWCSVPIFIATARSCPRPRPAMPNSC